MHDGSQTINSATDIKIFIEQNKSSNMIVGKEKFQNFEPSAVQQLGLGKQSNSLDRVPNTAFIIDENYMAKTVGQEETK